MKKIAILLCFGIASCNQPEKKANTDDIIMPDEQSLASVVEKYPDSLLAVESLVQYYRDLGRYDEAIATTNRAIQRDSTQARLWDMKAILYIENADTLRSLQSLEKSANLFPNPDILISLGTLYAQTKNKKSLAVADTIMSRFKKSSEKEAMFIKGLYYNYSNDKNKAISYFDECIKISLTYVDAYREKAIALYDLAKFEEALIVIDKAILLQPGYDEGHYYRGQCLEKMNRNKEAIEAYRTALSFDPQYKEAEEALEKLESAK